MALSKHATSAAGELSAREDTGLGPSGQRIENTNNHHEEAVAKEVGAACGPTFLSLGRRRWGGSGLR